MRPPSSTHLFSTPIMLRRVLVLLVLANGAFPAHVPSPRSLSRPGGDEEDVSSSRPGRERKQPRGQVPAPIPEQERSSPEIADAMLRKVRSEYPEHEEGPPQQTHQSKRSGESTPVTLGDEQRISSSRPSLRSQLAQAAITPIPDDAAPADRLLSTGRRGVLPML